MRISDWSSDVCSSDLLDVGGRSKPGLHPPPGDIECLVEDRQRLARCRKLLLCETCIDIGRGGLSNQRHAHCRELEGSGRLVGARSLYAARNAAEEIGRAHVVTPDTNAHLVCRPLLEKTYRHYQEPRKATHFRYRVAPTY